MAKRLFVLSIDGVPYTLLKQLIDSKELANFSRLASEAEFRQMDSVYPTVSAVAWTSYVTGKQPGKHGLYGFVERRPGTYDITIPLSTSIRSKTIWEVLSEAGRRVFGMNVPVTYPPRDVNGILISDFLCPNIEKAAASREVCDYLKSINYQIDADAMLARKSRELMLASVHEALDRRMEAMFHFLAGEKWDYFHTHVMETDRLCHFLLAKYEAGDAKYAGEFLGFFRRLDGYLGRLMDAMPADGALLVMSDHGFCTIKSEVQLSRYLVEKGWTTPRGVKAKHPLDIDPAGSRVYSLIPGRMYVNLRGREPGGIVPPEEYHTVREQVARDLMAMRAPKGDRVIRQVLRREEVYWPTHADGPDSEMPLDELLAHDSAFGAGPDLIAIPFDGYDLKMGLAQEQVFMRTELEGMHTYHDALVLARGVALPAGRFSIHHLTGHVLTTLGVQPPGDMDSRR
jgi:predicted AlkP superfamily phosphohydrolase/phosphomutase